MKPSAAEVTCKFIVLNEFVKDIKLALFQLVKGQKHQIGDHFI